MLVGLGHRKQVGKDTAAQILVEKYGFHRIAFADALKAVAYHSDPLVDIGYSEVYLKDLVDDVDWDKAKSYEDVRRFLQNLGVAARNWIGENVWVDSAFVAMTMLRSAGAKNFVITDVRFPNEFYKVRLEHGVLLRINRTAAPSGDAHVSETALTDYPWDYEIQNDGTIGELELKLVEVLGL